MNRRLEILGIGDADVDLFIKVPHLPDRDEKVVGTLLGAYPGGMVANYCCAASQLGARTGLVTVVGDDTYGRMAIADLDRFGVDRSQSIVRKDGTTYYCVVMLDDSGEKALTVVLTDCMGPTISEINPSIFAETRLVHLAAHNLELATWTARTAKEHGALVSLDLEPPSFGDPVAALRPLLQHVDLAFPNEAGIQALFGAGPAEGARRLLAMGPRLVVVTMGANGSLVATPDQQVHVPAYAVDVKDTTGAGDCFNAAFATAYLRGLAPADAARFASAAAALSITQVGSHSGLATTAEVEAFLATHTPMR